VETPEQSAVFEILVLLKDMMLSPLFSILLLMVNVRFVFLTGLTFAASKPQGLWVMVNLE